LERLYLENNQISDISSLSGMTNLKRLWLQGNPLNVDAYCNYLPMIKANNCGIELRYDPNPYDCESCPLNHIYGESSEEIKLLRYFRDHALSQTPEGREIIKLYYQWSPAIVKLMDEDARFQKDVKKMIDEVLPVIIGERE